MARREIGERDRGWLVGELSAWVAQGVIGEEQSARILDLYQTSEEMGRHRADRGIRILSALAALLVGLAMLLLVGFNWDALPDPIKLVAIFATIAATHALGLVFRYGLRLPGASEIVFFLGCLFFGAGIWLVAQVFNLSSNNYDGLWWWAMGTLPFAFLLDGALLHALLVALLGMYLGFSIFGGLMTRIFYGPSWRILGNAYASVPLIAVAGLLWAYRKKSPRVVGLYLPLIGWWLVLQPFAWGLEDNPVYLIGLVGCLLLILAECHREGSPMAMPYRFLGAILVAGVLVPLSVPSFHRGVELAHFSTPLIVAMTAVLVASVLAIVISAEARRRSSTPGESRSLGRLLFVDDRRTLPPALLAVATGAVAFWEILVQEPVIPVILANAAMLTLALWLIMLGLRQDRGRPFIAGVLYFLLWAILRYIDLFGDTGMLGAALLFFLCGAALFGMARFWQHRQSRAFRHADA